MSAPTCPGCTQPARLLTGAQLYPHLAHNRSLAARYFWRCDPCDATVGCHPKSGGNGDGTKPLGSLAGPELRRLRHVVHGLLDPKWQRWGEPRRAVYARLAECMGLTLEDCHVGMFTVEQCALAIRVLNNEPSLEPPFKAYRAVASQAPAATPATPSLVIYTDGSSTGKVGPGGWAFVASSGDSAAVERFGGADDTTNNRMEMQAIIEAMVWADGRRCQIFSDSQLCVNTLTTWAAGWKRRGWRKSDGGEVMNLDLVKRAHELYERSNATIQWVRGHNGNALNERADVLANMGRAEVTKTVC